MKTIKSSGCRTIAAGLTLLGAMTVSAAPLPPPPANPDPAALQLGTRAAIAQGVAYLKGRAVEDPDGWIVPPHRTRVPIGTSNVTVRFRERKVPKYEYETYTAYDRQPGADS